MNFSLYPFSLNFENEPAAASFPFVFENEPVLQISPGNVTAPSCLITGRSAGNMAFRRAHGPVRRAFFKTLHISPERVYSLIQVHSRDIYVLSEPEGSMTSYITLPSPDAFTRRGDGMVSFSCGTFLAVSVADCLPVFLLDTKNGYFAVLHSGWKGTGIVVKALEILQKRGGRPEQMAAVLGPCIQSCCYRVDEERAKLFEAEFGSMPLDGDSGIDEFPLGPVTHKDDIGWYLGLQAANARLLAAAGVRHIAYCTDCTFTDERLGSYRREGSYSYTRMMAMAGVFN
ncbi:MAG: polyphenol oxidase family protein [Treponema sp.]|nr:polyphenol oxidase family protein [Treponema sp.]